MATRTPNPRPWLTAVLMAALGSAVEQCVTTSPVRDATPGLGPTSLIYESRVRLPEGRIDQLRVAAHPLPNPTLPAYLVGFIHETPRTSGGLNRTLVAATTDAGFGAPTFLELGSPFPRRIPTLHDAIWVSDGAGRTTWMLVGTATGRERPSDPERRYWLWSDGPFGPSGVRGSFDFTSVSAAEERSTGKRYDMIRAGGSYEKGGQFIIVARRSQGLGEFTEADCLVAWLPSMFVPPPPHDPLGIYASEPYILDCGAGPGSIGQVAVSSLAQRELGSWLIAYTKDDVICARAINSSSGLDTTVPSPLPVGCSVTTVASPTPPSPWPPIRELEVDGGAGGRFLLAYTQDQPGDSGPLKTLSVRVLTVRGTAFPSSIDSIGAERALGTTTGGLRLAQESTTGAHWMLLDGGGIGGNLSYTRVRRFGHTGQIVQEFALRPPSWPFDHDLAYHPASDRFGVARPLLEPAQGLYGLTVPHTHLDQVTFLGSGCAGTISINGPPVPERHELPPGGVGLGSVLTRHFPGDPVYQVGLAGVPAGTSVSLLWSPRLVPGKLGACEAAIYDKFIGLLAPEYLPPGGSFNTIAGPDGTATVTLSLSDQPGPPRGAFPWIDNVPLNTTLYFQWNWTQLITPPSPAGPDRPVIRNILRFSNVAQVRFNP